MSKPYTIAVYYFPNYHVDPRNEAAHGPDWTEWALVKLAHPRFAGHRQPLVPQWGYEDEADPIVMAKKIDAAARHGIDAFIFDWYWYDDGPFLQRGLEKGFLGAANNNKLKFAIMWANHDWLNIHPAKLHTPPPILYPGAVTPDTFDRMTGHIIETYFRHPAYWSIAGSPYVSIYELFRLIEGFGSLEATREALQHFRHKTKAAGFPDLHLNAVVWGVKILPNEKALEGPADLVTYLGFDSVTSYVWIHHIPLPDFPETEYRYVLKKSIAYWRTAAADYPIPYYPNVTMGWDASPRTVQSDRYLNVGYPFMPMLKNNTPAAFQEALEAVKTFLADRPPDQRIFNINAWNEWTEGSYLEPDTIHGLAYLEAIQAVFGE